MTAAIMADPPSLAPGAGGPIPGKGELTQLVNVGLSILDDEGVRHAVLAEAIPTLENGRWKVLPDGRMETTWTLRQSIQWHDTPSLGSDDLLFTARVRQDPDLGVSVPVAFRFIEALEAPDQQTLRILWRSPYIWADDMFGEVMPKHLLERAYADSKESFYALPYWTEEFVGTGPYQLVDWIRGSHVIVKANDRYVLGRPKIDEIEVKFVSDANTLMSNVLAGAVDLTMSRGFSLEQALQLREQWRDGRIHIAPALQIVMYPQISPPTPPVMGDARFRRALLHALDRQDLVDNLMFGQTSVAHTTLVRPTQPEFKEIEGSIARYEFDPRKAVEIIEELRYTRGPDGLYRDFANQTIHIEIHTSTSNDIQPKSMFPVADYWQRVGLNVQPIVFPFSQLRDREYLMTRPGFYHVRHPHNLMNLEQYWHSSRIGLAENRFSGSNYARYRNAELDTIVDRFNATVPLPERMQVLKQIVRHLSEQVVVLGLFYDVEITAIGSRLKNVTGRGEGATKNWDAHLWDTR